MVKTLNIVRIVERNYPTSTTFALHFTNPEGRRRRLSVGKDYFHAQRLSIKFTDWLLAVCDPEKEIRSSQEKAHTKTICLKDVFDTFMERHGKLQSGKMISFYYQRFKSISRCPQLTSKPISEISRRLVSDYMHMRKKQDNVSNATVNRDVTTVVSQR